jgi:hypothetical protein
MKKKKATNEQITLVCRTRFVFIPRPEVFSVSVARFRLSGLPEQADFPNLNCTLRSVVIPWRRLSPNLANVPFGVKHYTISRLIFWDSPPRSPWQMINLCICLKGHIDHLCLHIDHLWLHIDHLWLHIDHLWLINSVRSDSQ